MKKNKKAVNKTKKPKSSMAMYVWSQKNKKLFAGTICIIIALGMVLGLLQV